MNINLHEKIDTCWSIYGLTSMSNCEVGECVLDCIEDGPVMEYYIEKNNHCIYVVQPNAEWLPLQVYRMARNVMKWLWSESNYIFMHSSVIDVHGSGVAFMGAKKSGKTSTLFAALSINGVSFCSNDDLSIEQKEDGIFWAYGWPRSLCVRPDCMYLLGRLFPKLESVIIKHPGNNIAVNSSKNYYLYPYEMKDITRKELISKTKLKCIIFPSFCENTHRRVERLNNSDALKKLEENLEAIPEKKCIGISDAFNSRDNSYARSVIKNMSNHLCFYKLYQPFSKLEYSKRFLEGLFREIL